MKCLNAPSLRQRSHEETQGRPASCLGLDCLRDNKTDEEKVIAVGLPNGPTICMSKKGHQRFKKENRGGQQNKPFNTDRALQNLGKYF